MTCGTRLRSHPRCRYSRAILSDGDIMRLLLSALCLLLLTAPAGAEKRIALVIGNSAYLHTGRLANPKNDATDMAAALKMQGFQVIEGLDLDKGAFDLKVRDFATALRNAEAGVFFYAGHGLQIAGQNYLVPIDARAEGADALEFEMVRVDVVHRIMERQTSTNILFLDACRDNPLARNLARSMGTRSAEIGRGLAPIESGVGTLISFSTQPGNVALDGKGRNSPFAGALVRQLSKPTDDLSSILIAVRNDVMKETQRKQVPWEHSALTGRFFFAPPPQATAPDAVPPIPTPPVAVASARLSEAAEAWDRAKDSSSIVLEAFVGRYKDTFYADLARAKLDELAKKRVAATTPAETVHGTAKDTSTDALALARSLQTELRRVGCDPGATDGKWGDKAKTALNDFVRITKSTIAKDDPSEAALRAVSAQKDRVCSLRCGGHQHEVDGKCMTKTKVERQVDKAPAVPKAASENKGATMCWTTNSMYVVSCSDASSSGRRAY